MKFYLPIFLFLAFNLSAQTPEKHTVSGYIKDVANGEALIGASVFVAV
jgi:hypothetical protein